MTLTSEDLVEIAEYMRRLEEDKTVNIIFESFDSIYGLTYRGNNDKYLIMINKNLSYELQIETLWHEAKHIYSHMGKSGDIKIFEKEASDFAKRCSGNRYLLEKLKVSL